MTSASTARGPLAMVDNTCLTIRAKAHTLGLWRAQALALSGDNLAHDRLRRLETFVPVEANRTLIARGDIELDDRLPLAVCPRAGLGDEGIGESTAMPSVLQVQGFDLHPLTIAPHVRVAMN